MNKSRVIIVGGGAAGIAAATRLVLNGFQNVTVLEAENKLGGRCNTVSLGHDCVDLGAQWIHGEKENVVYEMAAPLNMTKDSKVGHETLAHSRFIKPNGKFLSPEVSTELYCRCAELVHAAAEFNVASNPALSLGEVFEERVHRVANCGYQFFFVTEGRSGSSRVTTSGQFFGSRMCPYETIPLFKKIKERSKFTATLSDVK